MKTIGKVKCVCGHVNQVEYPDGKTICTCGATVNWVAAFGGMYRTNLIIPDGYTQRVKFKQPKPTFLGWVK